MSVLEVGCGTGEVLMECALRLPVSHAVGVDIDATQIEQANTHRERLIPNMNVRFDVMDAEQLDIAERFDVVLLPDVLEHIENYDRVVTLVYKHLKPGGTVLISVPTPLFPRVFGRDFHTLIGHVRDGFRSKELTEIFSQLEVVEEKYHAGPLVAPFCALSYRVVRRIPIDSLRNIIRLALIPTIHLDIWRPRAFCCWLFLALRSPRP
jgi:SAM-dependent methyltransferase